MSTAKAPAAPSDRICEKTFIGLFNNDRCIVHIENSSYYSVFQTFRQSRYRLTSTTFYVKRTHIFFRDSHFFGDCHIRATLQRYTV